MPIVVTQSKTVHRAGSLNSGSRFVQGELPLPIFTSDSQSNNINWSDGGKGGRFIYISGLSVAYQPPNVTDIITITADAPGGPVTKTLTVFGTFPLYPQIKYQIEEDQETKIKKARDGTPYFSEPYKQQITWKIGMDRRLSDERLEIWNFLIAHRKVKLFWVYDEEAKIMNKVRRVSAIPQTYESANSWTTAVVLQGDYSPISIGESGLAEIRLNCGSEEISGVYGPDAFYVAGSNGWDFGASASIDTNLLTENPGFGVLRYCRYSDTEIEYEILNLVPSNSYEVTLYFAGPNSNARVMNMYFQGVSAGSMSINGAGQAKEKIQSVTSSSAGVITINVEYVSGANAILNGIKIIKL